MLQGSTDELVYKGLLSTTSHLLSYRKLKGWLARQQNGASEEGGSSRPTEMSSALLEVASQCDGLSGRTVRHVVLTFDLP